MVDVILHHHDVVLQTEQRENCVSAGIRDEEAPPVGTELVTRFHMQSEV